MTPFFSVAATIQERISSNFKERGSAEAHILTWTSSREARRRSSGRAPSSPVLLSV